MNETLNQIAIERAGRIVAAIKNDIASYEASAPSNYRDTQLTQLREQLAKREATLAQFRKGN